MVIPFRMKNNGIGCGSGCGSLFDFGIKPELKSCRPGGDVSKGDVSKGKDSGGQNGRPGVTNDADEGKAVMMGGCGEKCKICAIESYLSGSWRELLRDEFEKSYMLKIVEILHRETVFYPPVTEIFAFSKASSFENVKVVIFGQDPYHNENQAMGLAFSVPIGQRVPPSLQNIYREIKNNYESFTIPHHGNLTGWASQGVLLLNDSLTVRRNSPNSHSDIGWENFTSRIVVLLNSRLNNLVFMLWGRNAQKKSHLIDSKKHFVLKAAHPSPYSADHGFFGCGHFRKANIYLREHGKAPINWEIL